MNKNSISSSYISMWPREMFDAMDDSGPKKKILAGVIEDLAKPGVYILYRDEIPYYIGQAKKLRTRLRAHSMRPDTRYYNFWNFFSAFIIEDQTLRNQIESILIAAMPTANSAKPRIQKTKIPKQVAKMMRAIRKSKANFE